MERVNSISGRSYKDDATIFAWDLVNEPRCETWRVRFVPFAPPPFSTPIRLTHIEILQLIRVLQIEVRPTAGSIF